MWEVQAATRHLRLAGQKSINLALLNEAVDKQREIVRAAQAKTRTMRRKQQVAHRPATVGIDPLNEPAPPPPKSDIDWSKPALPFDGEVWHSRRR
jgi:putative transposase